MARALPAIVRGRRRSERPLRSIDEGNVTSVPGVLEASDATRAWRTIWPRVGQSAAQRPARKDSILDARQFDRMTRLLSGRFDRRTALSALGAAAALAGIAVPAGAAPEPARCVQIGSACNKNKDRCCQQGQCK